MPNTEPATTADDESRDQFLARIAALPPLTDEQLDSLADLLAWIELESDQ